MTPTIFILLFMMFFGVVILTLAVVDPEPIVLCIGLIILVVASIGFFVQEVRHETLVRKTAMHCMYHREEILKKSLADITNLDVVCMQHYREYFNPEDKE